MATMPSCSFDWDVLPFDVDVISLAPLRPDRRGIARASYNALREAIREKLLAVGMRTRGPFADYYENDSSSLES
jgi:hypothetical protein